MSPAAQRFTMAALDGFIWFKERNGSVAPDYWGVTRLAYRPEEGIANPGTYASISGTRFATEAEIEEARRTGGFYTYAPTYESLDDVHRVLRKVYAQGYSALRVSKYLSDVTQRPLWVSFEATAAQLTEAILKMVGKWEDDQ